MTAAPAHVVLVVVMLAVGFAVRDVVRRKSVKPGVNVALPNAEGKWVALDGI